VQNIRFQYRTAVNGTTMVKDQPLAMGDDAYIYYKGFVDGVAFDGGSNWDDASPYTLGLGSGSFIPGFEEGLVGVVPNQTSRDNPAKVTVTFPENYTAELAGKEAVFHVYVEYAVQFTLPEYDKAFVLEDLEYETQKEFYASDKAILSEFEDFVENYLVENRKSDVEEAKTNAVWTNLMDKADCKNLPQMELDYYIATYMAEAKNYYDYYTSMGNSEFMKLYPTVEDFYPAYFGFAKGTNWAEELHKVASRNVKQDMLTHAIAEMEGFETITQGDIA
jgi:trigger factor